jgi:predicted transcriptional regulator
MRTVRDIIGKKANVFNTISGEETVYNALQLMNTLNLSYLVVMNDGVYKGVISERDYSRKVILMGRHSPETKVKEIMSVDIPVVSMDDSFERCLHLVDDHKTRYLLVFQDEQFVTVITINDLLRMVIAAGPEVFDTDALSRLLDHNERIF